MRALFAFDRKTSDEEVLFKFVLWGGTFFPGYFMDETKTDVIDDAPYHADIDAGNLSVYRGTKPLPDGKSVFLDIAYRGGAKTTRTKLFMGYVISNDVDHHRRYMKILSEDDRNSKQSVTDIYNMFVDRKVRHFYPEIFAKTPEKRADTMKDFETATNVKLIASTVGVEQRGQIQDEFRPDFVWFDDFESRKTLRSAIRLQDVWDNMQEAYDGLSRRGGALYTCNYLSERGNVHKLVERYPDNTLIIPIHGSVYITRSGGVLDVRHEKGKPTWPAAYTMKEVEGKLASADDPAGEYLCTPAAGADVYFDRRKLDKMEKKEPIDTISGFKIFHDYDPSHRYGGAHDVASGTGLDHSTSVFIDFTQMPAQVVATFKSNTIKPTQFGDEIVREANMFGQPIVAPENNKYDTVIARLRERQYPNIYVMYEKPTKAGAPSRIRQWGWNTNSLSKATMLDALSKAVRDGHLELSDPDLIAEARAYTRDDLLDKEEDPRLATRHFDLLIAAAIAWQMKNHATSTDEGEDSYEQPAYEPTSEYEESGEPTEPIIPRPIFANEMNDDYEQPPYQGQSDFES